MVRTEGLATYAKPVTGVTECFVIFGSFGGSAAVPRYCGFGGD